MDQDVKVTNDLLVNIARNTYVKLNNKMLQLMIYIP